MLKRKLGNSNLEVSAIGLGCVGMSSSYGLPKDKQEMFTLAFLKGCCAGAVPITPLYRIPPPRFVITRRVHRLCQL